ncbi:MAG: histidine triad (HIT) family protein [Bermanella sp.]|jgi:histidine triad (HIT) family protein
MASIFSMIIAGEIPGHFVWRDKQAVAIMTIAPICAGHVLVIPVAEVDHWDDMPAELISHCLEVSRRITKAMKTVYACKRVSLQIVGLEVPHTHLHLIPINSMEDTSFAKAKQAAPEELVHEAERLRAALKGMGATGVV